MNTSHNDSPPRATRLLRIREVLRLCGLSRATLYREIKLHAFPAPVKLSARSVGWLQEDVAQWLEARIAQRGPAYDAAPRPNPGAAKETAATADRDQSPREEE
ncbi:AlpA family transcriptional regulator [Duganella sp. Leaf126]|uniref:helix-turn-helix transcriptional regulator n=1 Tax=Duganella sp. Leaf126 TaxID=1736266 RepID=UPI0009EB939F|nr:AlpA family transcriptional regulator [Duganella sp. Leaf126]